MSMHELLASYYGTNGAGQAGQREELEKQAQTELFCKLAADNGIDLNTLSDDQVQKLWNDTFSKEAEFPPPKDDKGDDKEKDKDDKDDKEKEAAAEFAEKKAAAEKIAEADFLGRVMAHSYVNELNKIAAGQGTPGAAEAAAEGTAEENKEAGAKEVAGKAGDAARGALNKVRGAVSGAGKAMKERAQSGVKDLHEAGKHQRMANLNKGIGNDTAAASSRSARNRELMSGGKKLAPFAAGGAAVAGGGAYAASKKKEGSALDELAAVEAVEKAAAAGFDMDEAAQRVNAVLTLGVAESEKIASAQDLEGAVGIRSLELLEAAGYPVTWEQ